MRILYAAMKYDYGKPEQGFSFEHYNFYHSLLHMGHDILYFDYMTLMQRYGREGMNQRLKEVAALEKPDLLFTVLFTDQFDPVVLRELTDTALPTLNWFCDDHWRFDDYSREWAPCFSWVVTTAVSALPKYEKIGYHNVIKSQWACNHFMYRKADAAPRYDVTFVGQPHGNRRHVIRALRKAGIQVQAWGNGWESGRISQEEMIRVFGLSRINLNLSNSSVPIGGNMKENCGTDVAQGHVFRCRVARVLDRVPFGGQVKAWGKALRRLSIISEGSVTRTAVLDQSVGTYGEQIKGRNFEIPGCGGFQLTGNADNLEQYYQDGREVVIFHDNDELIDKIRFYLAHEEERSVIAQAGHERTLREHTYAHRFRDIFSTMGFSGMASKPSEIRIETQLGSTEEVR
ncbi:MAG: glycosyltransferase [Nitrospira sp.]|nr:glycosyltransferase [Nitrospira sp.]MDH4302478.1 glycosyltransferase [Nitrospira sp.]MDH5192236.1 glycosyltransferase [Nitrospira sp.]